MAPDDKKIYSATYSNVPVYEYNVAGNHIMRRRSDDWINATHILKVADYDKPARTRILEREVQKGVHEKVQGGYGKYQGTWIPLPDGRELAQKNGVLEKLRPIFDFVPGDRSPPPAPKHATAASSKPRAPRAPPNSRRAPAKKVSESPMNPPTKRSAGYAGMHDYDQMSMQGGETPDDVTVVSEAFDDYDPQYTGGDRKRRRVEEMTQADKEHQLWADELLDYFMLMDSPLDQLPLAPSPPQGADLNRPIDDKGHTALHWAAAMGDLEGENKVAISMVSDRIHKTLDEKSRQHQLDLQRLGQVSGDATLSSNVAMLEHTNQVRGINTILMNPALEREDFIFYFDRLAVMLVEQAFAAGMCYRQQVVKTPVPGELYNGLTVDGAVSAVVILRGGACLETGLKRVVPDCRIGRMLIQTNFRTGEPELHYFKLSPDVETHKRVLLMDPQMSSGGAALMAVRVLLDHGVKESHIVFVTYMAGKDGLNRLMNVYPEIKVVVCRIVGDTEPRWVEQRYLGC